MMKKGDLVEIYNTTIGGKQVTEGTAKLIRPSDIGNEGLNDGYEFWQVEFTDQKGEYFDRIIKM
jgi:hypothetical protein